MQKEKKIDISQLAATIEADETATLKALVENFSDFDVDVQLLDDALDNVLLADYVGDDGNIHEPVWKLDVAKSIALARRHLRELHEIHEELNLKCHDDLRTTE